MSTPKDYSQTIISLHHPHHPPELCALPTRGSSNFFFTSISSLMSRPLDSFSNCHFSTIFTVLVLHPNGIWLIIFHHLILNKYIYGLILKLSFLDIILIVESCTLPTWALNHYIFFISTSSWVHLWIYFETIVSLLTPTTVVPEVCDLQLRKSYRIGDGAIACWLIEQWTQSHRAHFTNDSWDHKPNLVKNTCCSHIKNNDQIKLGCRGMCNIVTESGH